MANFDLFTEAARSLAKRYGAGGGAEVGGTATPYLDMPRPEPVDYDYMTPAGLRRLDDEYANGRQNLILQGWRNNVSPADLRRIDDELKMPVPSPSYEYGPGKLHGIDDAIAAEVEMPAPLVSGAERTWEPEVIRTPPFAGMGELAVADYPTYKIPTLAEQRRIDDAIAKADQELTDQIAYEKWKQDKLNEYQQNAYSISTISGTPLDHSDPPDTSREVWESERSNEVYRRGDIDYTPSPADTTKVKFKRVWYLNKSNGANWQGHAAIILETEDGKGLLYSYEGDASQMPKILNGSDVPARLATSTDANRRYQNFVDMDKFMENGIITIRGYNGTGELSKYDRYIAIPVSDAQGRAIYDRAEEMRDRNDLKYNLYANNCNQVAQQLLNAAGLDFAPTQGDPWAERAALYSASLPGGGARMVAAYKHDRDDQTIPNAAYHQGVKLAERKRAGGEDWEVGITGYPATTWLPGDWNPFK